MRNEEMKRGMSTDAGGEEETSTEGSEDWGTRNGRAFACNTTSRETGSNRLLFACTNAFVFLSAAITVVQQEAFRSVVIALDPESS